MNSKVLFLILMFAIYTGYKFLPVSVAKSQMKHAVEGVLEDIDKETSDKSIKTRVIRRASAAAAPIDEAQIEVTRETRPGKGNCRLSANPGGKPGEIERSYLKW